MCGSNNIPIMYCDNKYSPVAISNTFNSYHRQFFRLNEQISWSESKKRKLFKQIVIQKIKNQIELLKYLNRDTTLALDKLNSITNDNFESIEAIVAKIYFNELFGEDFVRFRSDEINSSLNYGYAMLRGVIKQTIVGKGLIPPLGLWHKSQFNNFNLADDIIEVYRPMVDYVTYHFTIRDDKFTKEERIYLQNVIFQKVKYEKNIFEFRDNLELYINQIISYMNGKNKNINFPILDSRIYEY